MTTGQSKLIQRKKESSFWRSIFYLVKQQLNFMVMKKFKENVSSLYEEVCEAEERNKVGFSIFINIEESTKLRLFLIDIRVIAKSKAPKFLKALQIGYRFIKLIAEL